MSIARIRYANSQLDDIAMVLAQAHPRANDYLVQAPVLAVMVSGKFSSHVTYGEVDRFAAVVARGPKLRDMLSEYGASLPGRKLVETAMKPSDKPVLDALFRLEPSTLAQATPTDSQRVWLDGIGKWLKLTPCSKANRARFTVAWIARRLGEDLSRHEQVDELIDYLERGPDQLNEHWTWARAMERVGNWHRQINDREAIAQALRNADRAASFDKIICQASLPDLTNVDGYDFAVLRTARHIQEEGVALHHCVSSYTVDVARGLCHIASVRKDGVNIATLQLTAKGAVKQIKGHCNQAASPMVRKACETYALLHWRPADAA